jgi:hypothetical protein
MKMGMTVPNWIPYIKSRIFIHAQVILTISVFLVSCSAPGHKNGTKKAEANPNRPLLVNHVEYLDNILIENSGLIYFNGKLWTINDSGGEPVLFALDRESGKALQAIHIENGKNEDWESLAQDADHVYICDVGNNYGRRNTLKIYKVPKDSIPISGNARIRADKIKFSYAGRPEEKNPLKRSSYDCEAAIVYGDSLLFFTKDWETQTTTLYTCPTNPGTYQIESRATYQVDGLVTGADISPDSSFIMLSGYKDFVPLVWVFEDFHPADYSPGKISRYDYPEFTDLQTEGIAIASPERVYISCEMTEFPAALYRIDLHGSPR